MSKFNRQGNTPVARTVKGPIATTNTPATTFEGGNGVLREPKGELFLLGASTLDITADTFYETGDARVARFVALVRHIAVQDPDWMYEYLKWLRGPGNIRTAAIVGAVQAALAMVHDKISGSRLIINTVLQRPDEPGEMLAYLRTTAGRRIPKPIKRGIADAVQRLYTERSLLKWDTASHGYRFGDVIELTHPETANTWQGELYKYAIDRRHNRPINWDALNETSLRAIRNNVGLRAGVAAGDFSALSSPSTLHLAGMTWEDALSLAGGGVDKADVWRAMIPSMGYMALLRNLRNFDKAGLSDTDVEPVLRKLVAWEEVVRSRQLPMRFLSAFRAAGDNLRWGHALEKALDLSLSNVPELPGKTLILVDTSFSMDAPMSEKSDLARWDAAVVFGLALARRCESVDVVSFSDTTKAFPIRKGTSLLADINRWEKGGWFLGSGTYTADAVRNHYKDHDRVIVLTDEQYSNGSWYGRAQNADPASLVPDDKMFYTFNLAGYEVAQTASSPTRVTLGGLSDSMFKLIPQIEAAREGTWPWETGE